jgi:hypothetical protein
MNSFFLPILLPRTANPLASAAMPGLFSSGGYYGISVQIEQLYRRVRLGYVILLLTCKRSGFLSSLGRFLPIFVWCSPPDRVLAACSSTRYRGGPSFFAFENSPGCAFAVFPYCPFHVNRQQMASAQPGAFSSDFAPYPQLLSLWAGFQIQLRRPLFFRDKYL